METTPQEFTDRARELQARVAPQIEQARQTLSDLNVKVSGFIRQNPGTCLLGALAFGYVFGKLVSRR
jgi:hypothetical protein